MDQHRIECFRDLENYLPVGFLLEQVFNLTPDQATGVVEGLRQEIVQRAQIEAECAALVKHVIEDATPEEIETIVNKATGFRSQGAERPERSDIQTPTPAPVPMDEDH